MRSNLAKVLLILFLLVATLATLTACANDEEPATLENAVLDSIDIEGGRSITIEEGTPFDPSAYTLIANLSDESHVRVQMTASMFTEEELANLSSAGDHTLTVSYSLNGITKSILLSVKVVAKVIEPAKYTVKFVMPEYDGVQYGNQLSDAYVSTLNKPFIVLNDGDPTFIEVEWYTRADFLPNMQVSFPLQLNENNTVGGELTIYGKAVDSRKINVRYYQRTLTQNDGEGGIRAAVPFYSDPNKYAYGANHRTVSLADVQTHNGARTGYEAPYLEIYNYRTGDFERLGYNEDFKIENKYIEPSKLSDEEIDIVVDAVYEISRFTVTLKADKNNDGTISAEETFYLANDYTWSRTPTEKSYFYFNSTLSASQIPTAALTELQVEGKSLSWSGYQLAGYDTIYVNGNLTLTGVYSDITYDVLFYRAVSGNLITSFSVPHGATVGSQVTPQKQLPALQNVQGYTFAWEYYLDASGTRYDIQNNDIASITALGALRVYEMRTANRYNSVFKFVPGSETLFERTKTLAFSESVPFPTDAELKTALPQYNRDYYKFEWFLERPVESSVALDTSRETQRAANTVYYLRVSDMRRLTVKAVLPSDFSASHAAVERSFAAIYFDSGSSRPSTLTVNISEFAANIAERYRYDAFYTDNALIGVFDGETVRFNNDFWTNYEDILEAPDGASADGYYDYGFTLYMNCAVRTFEVIFYEQMGTTSTIETVQVNYGESPTKPADYDTADRTVNGEIYSFYGWYSAPDDITSYVSDSDFATMETKQPLNFYAKWQSAKEGTYGVIYGDLDGYYAAIDYQGSSDEVRIATEINGRQVNALGADLLFNDAGSEVRTVYLHAGIEFIEEGTFTLCNSLENIYMSSEGKYKSDDGVLYEKNADGTTLTLIRYPILKTPAGGSYSLLSGTTEIADYGFYGYCGTGVDLGTSLEVIGCGAFGLATKLEAVILPNGLRVVGDGAFNAAEKLATVTVAGGSLANLTEFGSEVFDGTKWLDDQSAEQVIFGGVLVTVRGTSENITLDDGVRVIANSAFIGLKGTLKSFTATDASVLEIIGDGAFENCNLLSSVSILSTGNVVSVGAKSFKNTSSGLRVRVNSTKLDAYRQSELWIDALGENTETVIISQ